ncbi:MAG: DUF883 domain-containing protein [Chloroflexi bacterium]|nr:DUF883 domain-containing protein [Chloroflexota bacterium]
MTTELITNRGTVQGSKEHLVKDLKSVVGDADDLLKAAVNSTAEGFVAARTKVEATLGEANEYVRKNPWKIVGVAAAVGLATAFLLRRR